MSKLKRYYRDFLDITRAVPFRSVGAIAEGGSACSQTERMRNLCVTKCARENQGCGAYTGLRRHSRLRWSVPHETPEGVEMVPDIFERREWRRGDQPPIARLRAQKEDDMSENIENENEIMDEATVAVEATEAAEVEEAADDVAETAAESEDADAEEAAEELSLDDQLFDKVQKAARLLRNRKFAMGREAEADAARASELMRALKLLELKPQMEQKEMSDLLGMRLRELDGILREAEEAGAVTRVMPEEEDMRAILVSANENAEEIAASLGGKRKKLIPQLSQLDAEDIVALMDKLIDPLTEMGLDNDDRNSRGGFGARGGDRGPRKDFGGRGGDRGGRGGFGGRGGDRGPRKDFGDRGPRRDFGDRGDRGGRGGFGDRDRKFSDRNTRGGYGDRGGRGGYGSRDDRGGRGNYGDRRGGSRY